MPLIETEDAARRLARAIVQDVGLYNEEKLLSGFREDRVFEILAEEVEEGRALYKSRVSPDLYARHFYERAIVDILVRAAFNAAAKTGSAVESRIW